jgi:hypothetical protein
MREGDDTGPEFSAEQLPRALQEMIDLLESCRDHAARSWFDRIGNGIFEDDGSSCGPPLSQGVYRFRQGSLVAYIWQSDGTWVVLPWRRIRSCCSVAVRRFRTFRDAMDELLRRPKPWWRLW